MRPTTIHGWYTVTGGGPGILLSHGFPVGDRFFTVGLFGWGWGWGFWNSGGRDIFINVNRTVNINCTNCSVNVTRNNIRTASLRIVVATGAADPARNAARVAGVRTGMHPSASIGPTGSAALSRGGMTAAGTSGLGNRLSVASVQRRLSQGGAAFSRGGSVRPNRSFVSSSGRRAGFSRGGPLGGRLSSFSGSRGMFSTSRSSFSGSHGGSFGAGSLGGFSSAGRASFSGSRFAGGHGGFGGGGGGHRR